MKSLLLFICVIFGSDVFAQSSITATVSNFENDEGVCRACIFSSEKAFESNKSDQCVLAPVKGGKAEIVFNNVSAGNYAILLFHDQNNNGKLDTNFLGMPKEGYGASKNKLPFAAAPKFAANKFSVTGSCKTSLPIRLRNL